MNGISTRNVKIETAAAGMVGHVGLHALGAYADQIELGRALSARIAGPSGERPWLHDRGKVLVHAMFTLAGAATRSTMSSTCVRSRACSGRWRRTRLSAACSATSSTRRP